MIQMTTRNSLLDNYERLGTLGKTSSISLLKNSDLIVLRTSHIVYDYTVDPDLNQQYIPMDEWLMR